MNFQMIDAATALIGTGRKIAILAIDSYLTRSRRIAMISPNTTLMVV